MSSQSTSNNMSNNMSNKTIGGRKFGAVDWDRQVIDVPCVAAPVPAAKAKANDESSNADSVEETGTARVHITLHVAGHASVALQLDAAQLLKNGGAIREHAVPAQADKASIRLLDAKDSTWTPRSLRFEPSGKHGDDLAAFVGRAVVFTLADTADKVAGVIESVSDKCVVVCSPGANAALQLVDRSKVVHCSLPHAAPFALVADLGPVGESFTPTLVYTLPVGAIKAQALYDAELDKHDAHITVVGAWHVKNCTTTPLESVRLSVEEKITAPFEAFPQQQRSKFASSLFSSASSSSKSNNIRGGSSDGKKLKTKKKRSGSTSSGASSSSSGADAGKHKATLRFHVPGVLNLRVESADDGEAHLVVPFGASKTDAAVRNVAEFGKSDQAGLNDSAAVKFAVQFALSESAFGKAVPAGPVTLWRAAHKSEPRRLISTFKESHAGASCSVPTVLLPHWASLFVASHQRVTRTAGPLTIVPPNSARGSDIEANPPSLAEQALQFVFRNNDLPKGASLVVVDHALDAYPRHSASLPSSVVAEVKITHESTSRQSESTIKIAAHEFFADASNLTVPIESSRSAEIKFGFTVQYDLPAPEKPASAAAPSDADTSNAPNDDGSTPAASSSVKLKSVEGRKKTAAVTKKGWFS
jgi:hypothetical protein